MSDHLLTKPLRNHLTGLLGKIGNLEDAKVNQALIDCTMFLLIELSRIDQSGVIQ
jgi:hypothetical protein